MFRLIIVDDEKEIRCGLRDFFPWNTIGFDVVKVFSNGEEAFSFLTSNHVDVVLTDIRMPGMTGLELVRKAQQMYPTLRFVIISGYRDFEYAKECMSLGIMDYIVKPTKYEEILSVFNRLSQQLSSHIEMTNENSCISKVKKYIKDNIRDATLETAAESVGLSPYYLSTLFHQETGEKFYSYLQKTKLELAEKLLSDNMLSLQQIGKMIGYMNANSLTRAFKITYGCTPKDYRKRLK